jgi:TusA-related sulfurtransferase
VSSDREADQSDEGVELVEVDARGLRCPIPVIRLGAAIRDLPVGSLVRLLATDPAARSDVAAFCRMRGHELVETTDEPEHTAYLVRRAG